MNLDKIAQKYGTDKSSLVNNYAKKYDLILRYFAEIYTNILEVGVLDGASLRMWKEYFPNAIIHGVDVNPICKMVECDRIKIHIIDQGNKDQLYELNKYGPFDLVVDDGSHIWNHQILTFEVLFPFVRSGGIFIEEDICTSYWPEQYGLHQQQSCLEYFKKLIDEVNFNGFRPNGNNARKESLQPKLSDIESILFINSAVVVQKREKFLHL